MKTLAALGVAAAAFALTACNGSGAGEEQAAAGGPPPMPQPVTMAQRPGATGGEALYIVNCAMCHAPNGMGTGLIARRADVSLLEERDDLTADFVVLAARNGIGNMPAIPRGEVSDEDLAAIANYLAAGPHGGGE